MTKEQLQTIGGLIAGMQTAIVHLANLQARATGISTENIAQSFEATAEHVPSAVANRAAIQMVLTQIAAGLRDSSPDPEYTALLNRLLH